MTSFKVDFGRETNWGSIKFGAQARFREKKTDERAELYSGDGTWTLDQAVLPNGGDAYGFPTDLNPVPDNLREREILAGGTGLEFEALDSEIDSNVADFVYDEDILAAYLMANWEMDRTTLNLGVRVERTEVDNNGNVVVIVEEDANGPGDPSEDMAIINPISATNSYTDVLPSASIRFEMREDIVVRASAFSSVVRPRVEEVAYRAAIEDGEGELGNPDLDPFRALNLDASIAYYPTDLSVISAGVFYKKIEDFIFVQVIDDYEFLGETLDEAIIALNGEDATALGFEFNYQQHFGFLSPPFDGLILGLNYTYVDSEADTGERIVDMPKQSANIANVMLGYEKGGFDFRVAMKYRDRYIHELVDEDYDSYTDEHMQLDITAKYRFSDSWQLYAEITNLGDEPEYYYAGRASRAYQYDEFGTTSAIGIQYNFAE